MYRRHFMKGLGGLVISSAYLPIWSKPQFANHTLDNTEELIQLLIRENDRLMPTLLDRQNRQKGDPFYGGLSNRYGLHTAGGSANLIQRLASSYVERSSEYYMSEKLLHAMELAAQFLLRIQHEDGTVDLLTTNFHSTPDLGFVSEPLCLAYTLLDRHEAKETSDVRELVKRFLLKSGDAMAIGGIHTPNHRWVVSMSLARIHTLFPNQKYVNRVEEWLNEKIDIDPDGQYTERSTNIYSPLTDRALITIARLLNKPELFEPVRKNLEMTFYYVHPNGEVATEASGRQDQYQTGTLQQYYYPYRYMAIEDRNPQFAAMTALIPQRMELSSLLRNLPYFQEDELLRGNLPNPGSLPTDYEKHFAFSNLVRIRRGERDATILAKNPTLFTFQKGDAVLQGVRFASAFFGKGQFKGDELKKEGSQWVMEQRLEGPYYQPYPKDELPDDGNWEKMPRSKRPQSEVQSLISKTKISENDNGFQIEISIEGTDHVPLAIELGFRKGGVLSGVRTVEGIEDAYILEDGMGTYTYGKDKIEFSTGQMAHSWTQLRGALPKLPAMSVYITGFTPFRFQLKIR